MGHSIFSISKDFLYRMNRTIPTQANFNGALRSFGASRNPFAEKSRLVYGPTAYTRGGFESNLDQIKWGGGLSPVDLAIDRARADMIPWSSSRTAVILIGDGKYEGYDPVDATRRLKQQYGDNLCVYTVLTGSENPEAVQTMRSVAEAGGCGFYQSAKYLETPQGMGAWIERVLFEQVETPVPVAPKPAPAPAPGDRDSDGVPDDVDQCPDSPAGAPVNAQGCWIIDNVEYDFNRSQIRPEFESELSTVAGVMQQNPDLTLMIAGHTDNIGTEAYNLGLSERRAASVKQFLVDRGISGNRIETEGFGYSKPAATNTDEWGRAMNRRAEIRFSR